MQVWVGLVPSRGSYASQLPEVLRHWPQHTAAESASVVTRASLWVRPPSLPLMGTLVVMEGHLGNLAYCPISGSLIPSVKSP